MSNPYIDVLKEVLAEHTALQMQLSQLQDALFDRTRYTIQREGRCRVLMERLMERAFENDEELCDLCRAFLREGELSDTDESDERFEGSSGYRSP
jgi:hypothetical protein